MGLGLPETILTAVRRNGFSADKELPTECSALGPGIIGHRAF